ncbi:DUF1772 domain-containing protein [Chelatococcus sp. GCM10030263]|uniref:DUF1772 domain-containing protein n=1 Tax=Chelatococcus sp. GCM10030263 TaxID=3273387 RepID=UPI00361F0089
MSTREIGTPGGPRDGMAYEVVFSIALLSTALALGGALAHALEMPNKIGMSRDQYFVVQQAYRGWSLLGFLLLIELGSMIAIAALSSEPWVRWPTVAAIAFLVGAQALFWIYTYPANVATQNWTVVPDNWEILRRQWEYSHAAGAGFQTLAMSSLIIAALARARSRSR